MPKANPSLPYFKDLRTTMEQEYYEMERQPQMAVEFMTKRMNLPAQNCYTPVATWDKIVARTDLFQNYMGFLALALSITLQYRTLHRVDCYLSMVTSVYGFNIRSFVIRP